MGFHDIVLEHPPEPFVALPQVASRCRHAHLLAQQQDHGLHHEGKSAASPSPWHRGLQDSVFLAAGAGHPGVEFGAMLPEVQMPPLLLHRVVNRAELPALRASELAARLEIQPELQLSSSHIHLAFDHFPSTSQTQRLAEKNIGIHSRESALPIWRAPALPALAEGHSSKVPPERLPRRAVRGLGAHRPHQISSFHPLKMSRSPEDDNANGFLGFGEGQSKTVRAPLPETVIPRPVAVAPL